MQFERACYLNQLRPDTWFNRHIQCVCMLPLLCESLHIPKRTSECSESKFDNDVHQHNHTIKKCSNSKHRPQLWFKQDTHLPIWYSPRQIKSFELKKEVFIAQNSFVLLYVFCAHAYLGAHISSKLCGGLKELLEKFDATCATSKGKHHMCAQSKRVQHHLLCGVMHAYVYGQI